MKHYLAIDTEYNDQTHVPFIITTCDERLKTNLYELNNKIDYKYTKRISEDRSTIKVFHNTSADIYACSLININISTHIDHFEDTMLIASLLQNAYSPKGLKPLARTYLNDPCEEEKLLKKVLAKYRRKAKKEGKIFTWDMIPKEIIAPYATKDPEITLKLFYLWKEPIKQFQRLYNMEKRLVKIDVERMKNGMRIDRKFVLEQFNENTERLISYKCKMRNILKENRINFYVDKVYKLRGPNSLLLAEKRIQVFAQKHKLTLSKHALDRALSDIKNNQITYKLKEKFSPTSSIHLQKIVKKLKIPITDFTDTGLFSLNRDTLLKHKSWKFIRLKIKHAILSKQNTTYYGPLYTWYTSDKDDHAHFSFWQSEAKTGRQSAELIQTIPRPGEDEAEKLQLENRIREAFIPDEDYFIISIDFSQIELRLFAHFSNAKVLLDAFLNNEDPYVTMAYKIFLRSEMEKNFKELRRITKTIVLGTMYGMGVDKMILTLMSQSKGTFEINKVKASDIMTKFHKIIPVRSYTNMLIKDLYKKGSLEMRFDSELMQFVRTYNVAQGDGYKAPNLQCQGSAAYVLKYGSLRLWKCIKERKLDIKLLALVHDEYLMQAHKSLNNFKTFRLLKKTAEDHSTFKVPILAAIKTSDQSWGKVKEITI